MLQENAAKALVFCYSLDAVKIAWLDPALKPCTCIKRSIKLMLFHELAIRFGCV